MTFFCIALKLVERFSNSTLLWEENKDNQIQKAILVELGLNLRQYDMTIGRTSCFVLVCEVCIPQIKHKISEETVL